MTELEIRDLHVSVEGKQILKGVNLTVKKGTVHVLMGPNGTGKSSLAQTLMGNPHYHIDKGNILIDGEDVTALDTTERAKKGLFLSFQYPSEITGVTMSNFLRTAYNSTHEKQLNVLDFHNKLKENMEKLNMDTSFKKRYLNEGFSGGEKKKAEILQLLLLQPSYAILDECDSGLDVNALKTVGEAISAVANEQRGILIITHYYRILEYLAPDTVSILSEGKIAQTGGKELAQEIEKQGFEKTPLGATP